MANGYRTAARRHTSYRTIRRYDNSTSLILVSTAIPTIRSVHRTEMYHYIRVATIASVCRYVLCLGYLCRLNPASQKQNERAYEGISIVGITNWVSLANEKDLYTRSSKIAPASRYSMFLASNKKARIEKAKKGSARNDFVSAS